MCNSSSLLVDGSLAQIRSIFRRWYSWSKVEGSPSLDASKTTYSVSRRRVKRDSSVDQKSSATRLLAADAESLTLRQYHVQGSPMHNQLRPISIVLSTVMRVLDVLKIIPSTLVQRHLEADMRNTSKSSWHKQLLQSTKMNVRKIPPKFDPRTNTGFED